MRECFHRPSQYTVWCWVLIDSRIGPAPRSLRPSQYTVWCWVLIDAAVKLREPLKNVSIHRVVLGAYRRDHPRLPHARSACVSIHRVVLGAYRRWRLSLDCHTWRVSIHRVVLGAYRPSAPLMVPIFSCLNTPCGAGCLSTGNMLVQGLGAFMSQYTVWCWVLIDRWRCKGRNTTRCLNTPCGAGCLSTCRHVRAPHTAFYVSIHRVVLGAYRQPPLQAAPQRRLLYGSRHRRFTHPDSPVSTASIRPHSCVILPLNGHAPPIAPTPSLAPTFDGLKPKSPPLSELSQCPRVHSRLTAKPKQMRALKTPTSRSRVRVSGAGDSRGARATAVADAMAHRSKSQP